MLSHLLTSEWCSALTAGWWALGFHYVDGHDRACFGTRKVQKAHVARLKFPATDLPGTAFTTVSCTDDRGRFAIDALDSCAARTR